jgi:phenylacetate-coenzyme A ligase PaaK-like adenylate-forming protein
MHAPFVFPATVSGADLETAAAWFDEARGRQRRSVPRLFDDDSWRRLPFTGKADLRVKLHPYPETGRWITTLWSSGTTAAPVASPWSEADQEVADATAQKVHANCPSIAGMRCAVIAPNPQLAVARSMCREIELSGGLPFLVTPADPEALSRRLIDEEIAAVFTLPMVASRLGEYFHAEGAAPDITFLFCGGDVLSKARQARLAEVWDAPVLDLFGCSELFGPLAGPSQHGAPLAWHCEPVAVEVVDPSTLLPCGVGDRGVIVLTTLWPKASPLLRYWTDDIVEVTATAGIGRTFAFRYVGRQSSMLTVGNTQIALRDIDDVVLTSESCGSEWSIQQTGDGVRIDAEMASSSPAAVNALAESLRQLIPVPLELVRREVGSLPRNSPKRTLQTEIAQRCRPHTR